MRFTRHSEITVKENLQMTGTKRLQDTYTKIIAVDG